MNQIERLMFTATCLLLVGLARPAPLGALQGALALDARDAPLSVLAAAYDAEFSTVFASVRNGSKSPIDSVSLAGTTFVSGKRTGAFLATVQGRIDAGSEAGLTASIREGATFLDEAESIVFSIASVRFANGGQWSADRSFLRQISAASAASVGVPDFAARFLEPTTESDLVVTPELGGSCATECLDYCRASCGQRIRPRTGNCGSVPCVSSSNCNLNWNANTGICEGTVSCSCDTSNPEACGC